jgi:hypothetical protein
MGPLVFTILVAAGQAETAETHALLQALVDALGGEIRTVVHEENGPLTDEALIASERGTTSDVTAAVSWAGSEKVEARVRVHVRASDRWIDRTVGFAFSDDLRERGRTLGFTIASMLPDRTPAQTAATPIGPRPPPTVALAPSVPPPRSRLALDLMVMGSLGVGGNADGAGGALALRRVLAPRLAMRAEVLGRTGVVQSAQATSLSVHLGVGVTAGLLGDLAVRRANLALRADLALFYESLGHLSADDVDRVRQARLLPGGDLMLEGSLPVLGSAALVLGLGAEVAFGRTEVFVHERRVAVLPPLRLVSTLGLRHHF